MVTPVARRVGAGLRTGRAVIWIGMAVLTALGWLYMVHLNAGVAAHAMVMPANGLGALLATFIMWVVMMTAMMLPSMVPTVSIFMTLAGRRSPRAAARMTAMFVVGYALAWIAYCVPAAAAQWGLARAALLSPMGESTSQAISAAILIAAGTFEFSGLKNVCVVKCRSPLTLLMHQWRDGGIGALETGVRNGANCVGCCWALMAVLFVVGTMNLLWMALFTLLVCAQKMLPGRWRLDRIIGTGFIAWGVAIAAGGAL